MNLFCLAQAVVGGWPYDPVSCQTLHLPLQIVAFLSFFA